MQIGMLKSKLHRATVTQTDLHYNGSITIDRTLMEAACLIPYEQVDVLNITNGNRFTTYVIEGPCDSGIIGINGAAAHLTNEGDLVIICSYAQMELAEAKTYEPVIVLVNKDNRVQAEEQAA